MNHDQLIGQLQPTIGAVVAFWKEKLSQSSNPQHQILEQATNELQRPGGSIKGAFALTNVAALASQEKAALQPLSASQIEQFGHALHQSIEGMIRQTDVEEGRASLQSRAKYEFDWRLGIDYDLECIDPRGRRFHDHRDIPLAKAATAIDLDPQTLRILLPWKARTSIRFGLAVPRALVFEQDIKHVLAPSWMVVAAHNIEHAWTHSILHPGPEEVEIEALQEIQAEQPHMRLSLGRIQYRLQPGALIQKQDFIALIDIPADGTSTIEQATQIRRTTIMERDLPDLLAAIADQYPPSLHTFLESTSWKALNDKQD